jgi:lipopolysaccharide cholinephosphotransferase
MSREVERGVELRGTDVRTLQLEALDAFAQFSARHELRWWMCAGSLLGAVRHGGYIPWDDDIDVMLARPEYERLIAAWEREPVEGFRLRRITGGASYALPFCKLEVIGTTVREPDQGGQEYGVGVDVFPVDGWPRSPLRRFILRRVLTVLQMLHEILHLDRAPDRAPSRAAVVGLVRIGLVWLWPPRIGLLIDRLAARSPEHTALAGVAVWNYREQVPAAAFSGTTTVAYEGRLVPAPVGWATYLRHLYGDYEELPPEDQRRPPHNSRSYRTL